MTTRQGNLLDLKISYKSVQMVKYISLFYLVLTAKVLLKSEILSHVGDPRILKY